MCVCVCPRRFTCGVPGAIVDRGRARHQSRSVPWECRTRFDSSSRRRRRRRYTFFNPCDDVRAAIAMCRLYAVVAALFLLLVPPCADTTVGRGAGVAATAHVVHGRSLKRIFDIRTTENHAGVDVPGYMYDLYRDAGNRRYNAIRSIAPRTGKRAANVSSAHVTHGRRALEFFAPKTLDGGGGGGGPYNVRFTISRAIRKMLEIQRV